MEFEREATDELKSKRLESLVKLIDALNDFGESWQTAFPVEEREKQVDYLETLCHLNNISGLAPVSIAFILAGIMANEVNKTMAALAEKPTL